MPLGLPNTGRPGGVQQLLACASLAALDEMLAAVGLESLAPGDAPAAGTLAPVSAHWVEKGASAIAFSINTSSCQLDLDGVVVGGAVGGPCGTA
jgi:hypothetical protein